MDTEEHFLRDFLGFAGETLAEDRDRQTEHVVAIATTSSANARSSPYRGSGRRALVSVHASAGESRPGRSSEGKE